jgi:Circularly permutated YpsA SLOG family
MLDKIVSGGETGANQAAWQSAKAVGLRTGGWMRTGFSTDDGSHPEFAREFAAAELPADSEHAPAAQNVKDSDGTFWFGRTTTLDAQATVAACLASGKPLMPVYPGASFEPSHVAGWILENKIKTLNVAGNREHEEPGIGQRLERFLGDVLAQLGHPRANPARTDQALPRAEAPE